jgi:hypothetical protein
MPLDFPNSPTNGQIFTSGIKKWQWSTAEGSWQASNYAPSPENVNGIVKSDGSGNFSAAVPGTDYLTGTQGAKAWVNFTGYETLPSSLTYTGTVQNLGFGLFRITINNHGFPNGQLVYISGTGWTADYYSVLDSTQNTFNIFTNTGPTATTVSVILGGGIRSSYNVSSVTDNGVGDYIVNFATSLGINLSPYLAINYTGYVIQPYNASEAYNGYLFDSVNSSSYRIKVMATFAGEVYKDAEIISFGVFGN